MFLLRKKTFKMEGNDFWKIPASKNMRLKHGGPL